MLSSLWLRHPSVQRLPTIFFSSSNTLRWTSNVLNIIFNICNIIVLVPNFGVTEIAKRIGAKWTGLSDATKKVILFA